MVETTSVAPVVSADAPTAGPTAEPVIGPVESPATPTAAPPSAPTAALLPDEVADVDRLLGDTLRERGSVLTDVSPELAPVAEALAVAGRGGKRLRATFALLGARSVGEGPVPGDLHVATALEMFHLAALVHDDLMDHSETRRGEPTVHHRFGAEHRRAVARGDADHFGVSVAVLAGDLCLTWSDDLLATGALAAGDPGRAADVRGSWSRMRDETLAGQYLDVLGHTRDAVSPAYARRVLRYKSAAYTVEQPLVLGARLAGAPAPLLASYGELGLAAGEAFQLRDDLLGVLGDPAVTGKPVVDDVREGKRTLLVSLAQEAASPAQAEVLAGALGDPELDDERLAAVQDVLVTTGAVAAVERRIDGLAARATSIAAGLPVAERHRDRLAALIALCAWRDV
ncbi:polyprenyl synthetase family protein [Nocardioides lentus]|uniref:Polyprenyl synthetase family protein n=1 Tax=Nocardioides lentus TaxID=338077 RepID=A0ABP5A6A1_9ACTN